MDYEEFERSCDAVREVNNALLKIFEDDLRKCGLSERTIRSHLSNVDFYINEYLLREEPRPMEKGVSSIDMFLGYFFIRKCMWSTPGTIKSTAASIKKFYKSMTDHEKLKKADYDYLCAEIKSGMPQWQSDCAMFNDPEAENPFALF